MHVTGSPRESWPLTARQAFGYFTPKCLGFRVIACAFDQCLASSAGTHLRTKVFCLRHVLADGMYERRETSREADLQVTVDRADWCARTLWKHHEDTLLTV